jgi:hypothetical protein
MPLKAYAFQVIAAARPKLISSNINPLVKHQSREQRQLFRPCTISKFYGAVMCHVEQRET